MENKFKAKLKRRGKEMYIKYFFNNNDIIDNIIKQYDNKEIINESNCTTIFNISDSYIPQMYELIKYYPNKLKEIRNINDSVINSLYQIYGETIDIMNRNNMGKNVRGKISDSANRRAKEKNIVCTITNEDILLVKECPYLKIPIEYGNSKVTNNSASIDKIIPELGYIKDNIQIISMLANTMKSNANTEQLITFSKNVLKKYLL